MSRRDGNTSMPMSHPMAINGYESARTPYTATTDPNMHMYVARMQAARNNRDAATMLPGRDGQIQSRHQQQQRKPTEGSRHRYEEIYDNVFAPHSRTPTEARTGSLSTAGTASSGRSSSSTDSGEEWEENIMSALNDMAGNLKKIGGIQCNQAGPDATEVQLKLNLPVPMKYMDQLGVDAKEGFNSAIASLSPKKCSFQYNDLDGQVVDIEERFLGTIDQLQGNVMPMYKSLFESQSGSTDDEGDRDSRSCGHRRGHGRAGSQARRAMADDDDDSESTYEDEPFLDRSPVVPVLDHPQATRENLPRMDERDVRQMRPSLMKQPKSPQTKHQNAAVKRTDDSPIPSEIVISDQPSDISSSHSWQLTMSPRNYKNNNETTKISMKEHTGLSSHQLSRLDVNSESEISDEGMPSFDEARPRKITSNEERSKMEISKALATISNALAKTATPIQSSPWIAATKGKLTIVDQDSPTIIEEGPSEKQQAFNGLVPGGPGAKKATPKTRKVVPPPGVPMTVPMDVECVNHGDSDGWNSILESCSDLTMDLGAVPIITEVVVSPKELPGVKTSFSGDELMQGLPPVRTIYREEASLSNSARQPNVLSQAILTKESKSVDIGPKTGLLLPEVGSPKGKTGEDESTTSKMTSKAHTTPELATCIPSPEIEDTDELMGCPKSPRLDTGEVFGKLAVTQSSAVQAANELDLTVSICRSSKDDGVELLNSLKDSGKDGGMGKCTSTPSTNGAESNPIAPAAVPDPANPKLELLPTQKVEAESVLCRDQTGSGTSPKHESASEPKPLACQSNKAFEHKPKDSDELTETTALPSVTVNPMVTVLSDEMPDDELMARQKTVTAAEIPTESVVQKQKPPSLSADVPEDEMIGVGSSHTGTTPMGQTTELPLHDVDGSGVEGGPKNVGLDNKYIVSAGISPELKASLSDAPSFGGEIDKLFDAIPAEAKRFLKPMQNEATVTPSSSEHSFRSANEDIPSEGGRRVDGRDAPLDNPSHETRNFNAKPETMSPRSHPNREALYQMQGFDEYRKSLGEGIVKDRIDVQLACVQSDLSLKDGDKSGKCAEAATVKEETLISCRSDESKEILDEPQREESQLSIDGSSDPETSSIDDPSRHQSTRTSHQLSVNNEGYYYDDDQTLSQKTDCDDYSSDDEGSFEGRESEECSIDEEDDFEMEAEDAKSEANISQKSFSAPQLRSEIDIEAEQVEVRYLSQHTRSLHNLSSGATVSTTETPGTMQSMLSFRTRDVTAQSRTSSAPKLVPVSYSSDTPMTAQLTTSFTNDTPLAAASTMSAMRTFDQETLQTCDSNDIISILSSMHSKKNVGAGVTSAALTGSYRKSMEGNGVGTSSLSERNSPVALLSRIQNALMSIVLFFIAWCKHILGLATLDRPTKIGFSQEQLRFQANMVLRSELLHTTTRSRNASHGFHHGEEVGTCLESIVPDVHMSDQNVEVMSVSSSRSSSRVLKQAYSAFSGSGNLRRRRKAAPLAESNINWFSGKDLDDMDDETILSYLD